jgi:hypothetical protein
VNAASMSRLEYVVDATNGTNGRHDHARVAKHLMSPPSPQKRLITPSHTTCQTWSMSHS